MGGGGGRGVNMLSISDIVCFRMTVASLNITCCSVLLEAAS